MIDEQAFADLVERIRHRYYGKYRGVVTDVESGGRARIKAKVPAVLGEQKTGWCEACVPYAGKGVGLVCLPEVGSGVWIEFEGGDLSHPIWAGCTFRDDELPSDAAPAKKVLVTAKGHKIVIDDEGESVVVTDSNGNEIALDNTGIKLSRGGQTIEVTSSKVAIDGSALEVQ